jgi:hypothetical protein
MSPAPVALFAYRRAAHTRQAVESLLRNDEAPRTHLVVYADGPRTPATLPDVQEVRRYLRTVTGFASIRIVEREANLGLARSIIAGVGEVLGEHGRIIVVEDDLVVSPYFLRFMNDGLRRYAQDERVASIHGYQYPVAVPLPDAFFLRGADCWGWATWSRAWACFRADGQALLADLEQQGATRAFDLDGHYPFTRMLRHQVAGRNDSWAIRWHASAWLAGLLTLYPGRSHVRNTGADGTGTHSRSRVSLGDDLATQPTQWGDIEVAEHAGGRAAIAGALRRQRRRVWIARLRRVLRPFSTSAA